MRVGRSLGGVPAHPAAHARGSGRVLDDRLGSVCARGGLHGEGMARCDFDEFWIGFGGVKFA